VKIVSTLDVLSGGRAYLGIGPGGMVEREMKGLGIPRPPLKDCIERLEETLQIFHHMWRREDSPYTGKYYQLAELINSPQPLTQPHPPIMIGMWKGGKKMLELTAKYADACNLQFGSPRTGFRSLSNDSLMFSDCPKLL
jgi:alkanesulfonate monooxygenase SsuD/methylene tetrahydromethanopterin reductase-like flavin-dependent oxidoreductase (luciferase family)